MLGLPFIIYLVNSGVAAKERRGIAAGIPKQKQAKAPKQSRASRTRTARVRSRRVDDCGRGFTHFALALLGSQESCRYCRYLEEVPQTPEDDDSTGPGDSAGPSSNEPVPLVRPANE